MSNVYLVQKLLETKQATLMEGNTWDDRFWGVNIVIDQGLNHLGVILMTIRDELKSFMTIPTQKIDVFDGAFFFLSNAYEADIEYDDMIYPSNEHAFQSAKTVDPIIRRSFLTECQTPDQANEKGRRIPLRQDWEKIKIYIMKRIIKTKFLTHPNLRYKLLATGDTILVEGNTWHDTFWGVDRDTNEGCNYLGLILMQVRTEFRAQGEKQSETIEVFEGKYFFLSNSFKAPVEYDGLTYPSVEHAFQAAKSLDSTIRQSFCKTVERQIKQRKKYEKCKFDRIGNL